MKLIFICGSIEPGRDGVGDYTRNLACEISRQGHHSEVLALYDQYVTEVSHEKQYNNDREISVFRIPSLLPENDRFKKAQEYIIHYNPDWISLQYVPYGFHPKGLPFFLGKRLRSISSEKPIHIMYHEGWIGTRGITDWKGNIISTLQKSLIKKMIKTLSPAIIHTHLPTYYTQLQKLGFEITKLPLFSNFSKIKVNGPEPSKREFKVGFFSQIGISENIVGFLKILKEHVAASEMQLEILCIGGNESHTKAAGALLEKNCSLQHKVEYTGFLEPEEVSSAIQSCSLGLTPIPRHGLGKSSSLISFIAHGVPVAAPNIHKDHNPAEIGFFSANLISSIVTEPTLRSIELAKAAAIKAAGNDISIKSVSMKFLSDLDRAQPT